MIFDLTRKLDEGCHSTADAGRKELEELSNSGGRDRSFLNLSMRPNDRSHELILKHRVAEETVPSISDQPQINLILPRLPPQPSVAAITAESFPRQPRNFVAEWAGNASQRLPC